jgi:hypothetical protein
MLSGCRFILKLHSKIEPLSPDINSHSILIRHDFQSCICVMSLHETSSGDVSFQRDGRGQFRRQKRSSGEKEKEVEGSRNSTRLDISQIKVPDFKKS